MEHPAIPIAPLHVRSKTVGPGTKRRPAVPRGRYIRAPVFSTRSGSADAICGEFVRAGNVLPPPALDARSPAPSHSRRSRRSPCLVPGPFYRVKEGLSDAVCSDFEILAAYPCVSSPRFSDDRPASDHNQPQERRHREVREPRHDHGLLHGRQGPPAARSSLPGRGSSRRPAPSSARHGQCGTSRPPPSRRRSTTRFWTERP